MLERVEIRPCANGDLDALERAMPSLGRSRFHDRRLLEQLTQRSTYLVAWLDDDPVGHLNLRWRSGEPAVRSVIGMVPEVNALAVAPARQRQGIGATLLEEADRRARAAHHSHIGLAVNVENAPALRLYERAGYVDWGRGELDLCWTFIDDEGVERIECERCAYLLKDLDRGRERTKRTVRGGRDI